MLINWRWMCEVVDCKNCRSWSLNCQVLIFAKQIIRNGNRKSWHCSTFSMSSKFGETINDAEWRKNSRNSGWKGGLTCSTICWYYKFLSNKFEHTERKREGERQFQKASIGRESLLSDVLLSRIDDHAELLVIHWPITVSCTRNGRKRETERRSEEKNALAGKKTEKN